MCTTNGEIRELADGNPLSEMPRWLCNGLSKLPLLYLLKCQQVVCLSVDSDVPSCGVWFSEEGGREKEGEEEGQGGEEGEREGAETRGTEETEKTEEKRDRAKVGKNKE